MAEYIGFKALKQLNPENYQNKIDSLINFLSIKSCVLFDVRRISYMSGVLFWLCLDMFKIDYKNVFNLDKTLFEVLEINDKLDVVVKEFPYLKDLLTSFIQGRKDIINNFIKNADYNQINGQIVGYDPMNTFRYQDYLYCKNFVFIFNGEKTIPIYNEVILEMQNNSLNMFKGYFV